MLQILYPDKWKIDKMIVSLENTPAYEALVAGDDPRNIAEGWRDQLAKFNEVRSKYLLYK